MLYICGRFTSVFMKKKMNRVQPLLKISMCTNFSNI